MRLKGNIENLAYQTRQSAAFDLESIEEIVIEPAPIYAVVRTLLASVLDIMGMETAPPNNWAVVRTGVYIAESDVEFDPFLPPEHLLILPRSGIAARQGVTVLNAPGLIDADYPGEIKVILINHSSQPIQIKVGDRIAQCMCSSGKVENIPVKDVEREGGMGSTGV